MNTLTTTTVPSWIAAALGVATLAMLTSLVLLGKGRAKRSASASRDEKVIRRLFIAALMPSLLVIGAVMAISFVGLASFAQTDMGWHSWLRFIVPVSLDGISITFGFWAFVAVKRNRHPGRSERIVYVGALISAWINYNHGRQEWTGAAGIYLGFLSLASAWMFHELLSQFMDAQQALPKARRTGTPMFGERWLWAPWSTLMARRAWVVYPPAGEIDSTPANALAHLDLIRAQRATRKARHNAAVDAITRQLHQPPTTPTTLPTTIPAPTTVPAPTTGPVPTTVPVPAHVLVPAVAAIEAAGSTVDTPASAGASTVPPVPSPAKVADRITPKPQPRPRPADATPVHPAPRTDRPRTSTAKATPAPLTASSTDIHVAAKDPAQPMLPLADPQLLARVADIAREYQAKHGTRITPGQLTMRLRPLNVPSDQAATLLAATDNNLLATTGDFPHTPTVNGRQVNA